MGYVWCEIRQQSSEEPCDETSFGKKKSSLISRGHVCIWGKGTDGLNLDHAALAFLPSTPLVALQAWIRSTCGSGAPVVEIAKPGAG